MANIVLDPKVAYTMEQLEIFDELEQLYDALAQLHHSQQDWNASAQAVRFQNLDVRIVRLAALRDIAMNEFNKQQFQERLDVVVAKRDLWAGDEFQAKIADFGQQISSLNQRKDELEQMFADAGQ